MDDGSDGWRRMETDELNLIGFFKGRVRTKTVKKASRVLIEKYYPRLTLDFQTNKKICDEVAIIASKRLRNKIAGFTTHLMKRISRGPVRGISFKLQEEERERKDNYVPEFSALDTSVIEIDPETKVSWVDHWKMVLGFYFISCPFAGRKSPGGVGITPLRSFPSLPLHFFNTYTLDRLR
jgi:small subunit ribosomal protein S17e